MSPKAGFRRTSQKIAADVFDVDERTLRRWSEEGCQRNSDGTYDTKRVHEWLVTRHFEQVVGGEHQLLNLDQERARLAREQADKIALENGVRRGEVADLKTIGEELARALTAFRARMLAAPSKLAPRVNPENPNLARDLIAGELERILSELSAYKPGAVEGELSGEVPGSAVDPAAPAAAIDQRVGRPVPDAQRRKQRRTRAVEN